MGPMTGGGRGFCSPWGAGAAFTGRGLGRGFGRGGGGSGGWGFGFRGSSPPWPYVGLGRGGLPRGWYSTGNAVWGWPYGPTAAAPEWTKDQELGFLRDEAVAIKEELEQIDKRIQELETESES
jgi:hypothetical protein